MFATSSTSINRLNFIQSDVFLLEKTIKCKRIENSEDEDNHIVKYDIKDSNDKVILHATHASAYHGCCNWSKHKRVLIQDIQNKVLFKLIFVGLEDFIVEDQLGRTVATGTEKWSKHGKYEYIIYDCSMKLMFKAKGVNDITGKTASFYFDDSQIEPLATIDIANDKEPGFQLEIKFNQNQALDRKMAVMCIAFYLHFLEQIFD